MRIYLLVPLPLLDIYDLWLWWSWWCYLFVHAPEPNPRPHNTSGEIALIGYGLVSCIVAKKDSSSTSGAQTVDGKGKAIRRFLISNIIKIGGDM